MAEGKGTMFVGRVTDLEGQSTAPEGRVQDPEGSLFTIAEIVATTEVRHTILEEHQFSVEKVGTNAID